MEETLECVDDFLELLALALTVLPLGLFISMFMFMLLLVIGLESILISKGNNVFASSLLGATIQDGGMRERSNVPWSTTFFHFNNLLHGVHRQTMVVTS